MEQGDGKENLNTVLQIKQYLATPEHPLEPSEFMEFWSSLTDAEKLEYKNTELK